MEGLPSNLSNSPEPLKQEVLDYKKHLEELVNKSQDNFEKQFSFITAGSLTISMAFISNVVGNLSKTKYEGLLIIAWTLMAVTLLLNLLSHVYSSNCHNSTIEEINNNNWDRSAAVCRQQNIKVWNYVSIATLIAGIIFLLVFISINI